MGRYLDAVLRFVTQAYVNACEPQVIGGHEPRFAGVDRKIVSMHARGMSVREIQEHMLETHLVDVSLQLITDVTEAVMAEAVEFQNRPLAAMYPVVFFDRLQVKVRDHGVVRSKAIYLALGMLPDGSPEVLGLWAEQSEAGRFWLNVLSELKVRGVDEVLVAAEDGLNGFAESIEAVFPRTTVQTCILHLIRDSLESVPWSGRKAVSYALEQVYTAPDEAAARSALDAFEKSKWAGVFPEIVTTWRQNWERVIPFFAFAPEVRGAIPSTNAFEFVHRRLRKVAEAQGCFSGQEAATKLLWLPLRDMTTDRGSAGEHTRSALNRSPSLHSH
jgi:putative transposase